jgi:hypothetical protein
MSDVTYELCFDPDDGDVLIYRNVRAGVCGPFSERIPCASREEAERIARGMGYLMASEWSSYANYESADLVRA